MRQYPLSGAGLGLRRVFLEELEQQPPAAVAFYEVAPENWMRIGGGLGKRFRALTERFPFVCHGLTLNLGGPAPLDEEFLRELKDFLDRHGIVAYSEHLSYCADEGHLYDLMPIPFTPEATRHTAQRIHRAQEILERPIAIENVSYYATPSREMTEIGFLNAVVEEADCDLLLDLNNIYVNSINHGYDALDYLRQIPARRIVYAHMAGHYVEAPDLLVDTHGAAVVDPVWNLLDRAYGMFGLFPTLLERDFAIPPLAELVREVNAIRTLQAAHAAARHVQS